MIWHMVSAHAGLKIIHHPQTPPSFNVVSRQSREIKIANLNLTECVSMMLNIPVTKIEYY